jgi:YVTN family beta-propeller protein
LWWRSTTKPIRFKTTIGVGAGPFGVMADPVSGNVYVGNFTDNTVSVIDGRTNQVRATIPVGAGPFGLAVSGALSGDVYVSNANGNTLQLIRGV